MLYVNLAMDDAMPDIGLLLGTESGTVMPVLKAPAEFHLSMSMAPGRTYRLKACTEFGRNMDAQSGPKRTKSELRREAILKNALKMFDRQGFANTSLDDIARETGVKREAIYYYFSNRTEILLNIIRPQSEVLVAGLRKIIRSKVSLHDKLYLAVCNHLESFDRNCLEMTVTLRDVYLEDAKEVRREMDQIWAEYETMWTRLIMRGQRSGDFVRLGDPKMVAFGILGMCNWMARWYDPNKSISIDELVATYFNMIAYGLVSNSTRDEQSASSSGEYKKVQGTSGSRRQN